MLHQLRRANTKVTFEPVNRAAVCKYMKMITPEKLLDCLRTGRDEVTVPADVAERARRSVEAMIARHHKKPVDKYDILKPGPVPSQQVAPLVDMYGRGLQELQALLALLR